MTTPAPTTAPAPVLTVTAWRDYDPEARELDGMSLGRIELTGPTAEAAQRLWDLGARRVELPGVQDLTDTARAARTVQALCLVRDLTALAVYVDWRLRLGPDTSSSRSLGHLQPPSVLLGSADPAGDLAAWRAGHYLGKCLWRRGPGFLQIRDRRYGELRRFTVEEPEYHQAVDRLSLGAPASAVPAPILADLAGEDLVGQVGDQVWLLPYRVRRWTQAAMVI
ncbi:DUF5825 family protein [Streptacidiphilus cavernicola]|uniref:DUF5825 family protein n=1 Tax=Streptacidiphilus cavernicola TaxID=3342716 RepID=A0ABV6VZ87_9ACTN